MDSGVTVEVGTRDSELSVGGTIPTWTLDLVLQGTETLKLKSVVVVSDSSHLISCVRGC